MNKVVLGLAALLASLSTLASGDMWTVMAGLICIGYLYREGNIGASLELAPRYKGAGEAEALVYVGPPARWGEVAA